MTRREFRYVWMTLVFVVSLGSAIQVVVRQTTGDFSTPLSILQMLCIAAMGVVLLSTGAGG
jgi:hypothetical protein